MCKKERRGPRQLRISAWQPLNVESKGDTQRYAIPLQSQERRFPKMEQNNNELLDWLTLLAKEVLYFPNQILSGRIRAHLYGDMPHLSLDHIGVFQIRRNHNSINFVMLTEIEHFGDGQCFVHGVAGHREV